ncbi:MAG: DUF1835 domain-containing protein [Persicimonas sp.]
MADTFDRVVHVAPTAIADDLAELGAQSVVAFPDLLTHGPVATDPKRHRKERLAYWRSLMEKVVARPGSDAVDEAMALFEEGYVSTEQVGSAAAQAADDAQIVIWTTPTLEDRLFLWFCFEALFAEGIEAGQMATAEPQIRLEAPGEEPARFASLRSLEPDELVTGFDELFYPKHVYVEAGANLWETFASASPRQIAISIPHTTKFFPEFDVFAEDYGRLFPVARGDGAERLGLSTLDADLFSRLEVDREQTAAEIIDAELGQRYSFLDELVLLARLCDWGDFEPDDPYVTYAADAEADDVFERHAFGLTERGASLLEEGFEAGRKLPLFYVADSRLYAGKKPWVRRIVGENWWFERFEPEE